MFSLSQDIYATPAAVVGEESGVPMQAQVAALRLQAKLGPAFSIPEPSANEPATVTWLPYALAAASSSFDEVRTAAAACFEDLSAAMDGTSLSPAIKAAVSGLGASASLIRADPEAASQMLRARLLPQGEDGSAVDASEVLAPATGSKKKAKASSKGSQGGGSLSGVSATATSKSSQSSLPDLTPGLARELYAMMASMMADLSGNSLADLSAARATLACLLPPSDIALTPGVLEQKALLSQPCLTLLASLQDADVVINTQVSEFITTIG